MIRLNGHQNRIGWDFSEDGHALALRVQGTPLIADFDQRLQAKASEMENKWDPKGFHTSFDDVIVELTGRVAPARPIQFNRLFDRWDQLPMEQALHGVIIGFVRGPQAAGILNGEVVTSLEEQSNE